MPSALRELRAALKMQAVFRAKVARGEIRVVRAEKAADAAEEATRWIETLDPGSGCY